jgi:hypothetical protein
MAIATDRPAIMFVKVSRIKIKIAIAWQQPPTMPLPSAYGPGL